MAPEIPIFYNGINALRGFCGGADVARDFTPWTPPPGGYAGGKIAYNRIPSAEDFW
jgi:hypothetical protein